MPLGGLARKETMRVLIIQFVPPTGAQTLPRYDQELAVAATLLRNGGFDLDLLAMDGYRGEALHDAINRHRPAHVLVDIAPTFVTAARHTIVDITEKHFLPVTVVGVYPTCRPQDAISIPGVIATVVGEYDRAVVRLFRRFRDGGDLTDTGDYGEVPGAWLNSEDGLVRSAPAPLAQDLEELPMGDRELFRTAELVAASGVADFQATRGCPNWCAFCLNDWHLDLYAGRGTFHRRRSVRNLLSEIASVVRMYDQIRQIRFLDHAFAADADWLTVFARDYPSQCPLPYRCHVRLDQVTSELPALLARSGCDIADVEIGSGSTFIRDEVLGLRLTRKQIVDGVAALAAEGIRVHGRLFVGAPYESDVSIDEMIDLLAELALDTVHPRVYYPVPRTRAAEICAENGWISGRGEQSFHANRSVLDMPSLPADRIDDIAHRLDTLIRRRQSGSLAGWFRRIRTLASQPLRLGRRKRPQNRSRR